MRKISDVEYSAYKECVLDIYLPEEEEFTTLVYFHGGGLEAGDKTDAEVMAGYLTKHKVAVVSVNYRMYPNAKFPEYIEDAAAAVSWAAGNISSYGKNKGIYISGSSAGAYISMMLCFDTHYLLSSGINPWCIKGYIHDAGQPTCHFNVLKERGIDSRRIIVDEAAPLFFVGIENEYPPMVFIVSDNDMENRYEQIMLTAKTMEHFGHKTEVEVLCGRHCEYVCKSDFKGESIFGKIILKYMRL